MSKQVPSKPVSSSPVFSPDPQSSRCRHVRLNGARCAMPALTGRDLCFDHDRRLRARLKKQRIPSNSIWADDPPLVEFVYMEDHASVLANLNAIAHGFAHHQLNHRQAGTLTYLMQTILKTLRQMREFEAPVPEQEAVRDVIYDDQLEALAAPDLNQNPETQSENQAESNQEADNPAPQPSPQQEQEQEQEPEPEPKPQPEQEPDEPSIPQPLSPPIQTEVPRRRARRTLSVKEIQSIPPAYLDRLETADREEYEMLKRYFGLDQKPNHVNQRFG